jgi:DNA invertase Pin-like site-specific DNA recombinase
MERPGLEALLAYAREGDTLAVVRLDRLGRTISLPAWIIRNAPLDRHAIAWITTPLCGVNREIGLYPQP